MQDHGTEPLRDEQAVADVREDGMRLEPVRVEEVVHPERDCVRGERRRVVREAPRVRHAAPTRVPEWRRRRRRNERVYQRPERDPRVRAAARPGDDDGRLRRLDAHAQRAEGGVQRRAEVRVCRARSELGGTKSTMCPASQAFCLI